MEHLFKHLNIGWRGWVPCKESLLGVMGLRLDDLKTCGSVHEEFKLLKRSYFKLILVLHPDKNRSNDASKFREVQTSFELLREMYDAKTINSFVEAAKNSIGKNSYSQKRKDFEHMPTPSWDYYYEAAQEEVPIYRVEPARSDRSRCVQKGKTSKRCVVVNTGESTTKRGGRNCTDLTTDDAEVIGKGELRVGSLDDMSGTYGRWVHLRCWRVPSRIWLGLPNPEICFETKSFEKALIQLNSVVFCGFQDLDKRHKMEVIKHVMNKNNHAQIRKRTTKAIRTNMPGQECESKDYYPPRRKHFVIPLPSKGGCQPNSLAGKRVVLTGLFPEVGGGHGLNLGKAKVKRLIESFGGRVTSAISGRTDMLVVGKQPGYRKVSQAREREGIEMLTLHDLKERLEGRLLEDCSKRKPLIITTGFSRGYGGYNGLALRVSEEDLAIAAGTAPARIENKPKPPKGLKRDQKVKKATSENKNKKKKQPAILKIENLQKMEKKPQLAVRNIQNNPETRDLPSNPRKPERWNENPVKSEQDGQQIPINIKKDPESRKVNLEAEKYTSWLGRPNEEIENHEQSIPKTTENGLKSKGTESKTLNRKRKRNKEKDSIEQENMPKAKKVKTNNNSNSVRPANIVDSLKISGEFKVANLRRSSRIKYLKQKQKGKESSA